MGGQKSRKAFFPFPFNGSDTVSAISHVALAWKRKFKKIDPSFYAQPYLNENLHGLSATIVTGRTCHVCGFSLISLTGADGWVMEACSAHDIEKALRGGGLAKFLHELGSQHSYNLSDEHTKV